MVFVARLADRFDVAPGNLCWHRAQVGSDLCLPFDQGCCLIAHEWFVMLSHGNVTGIDDKYRAPQNSQRPTASRRVTESLGEHYELIIESLTEPANHGLFLTQTLLFDKRRLKHQ